MLFVVTLLTETLHREVLALLPLVAFFGALSYATKRRASIEHALRARPEIVTNVILWLVNSVMIVPLLAIPILALRGLIPTSSTFTTFWDATPAVVTVVATIMLIDLVAYWRHRIEHSRFLWPIHATHHADEALNWLSVRRKHPIGEALGLVFDSALVILLGLPLWAIVAANMIRGWWGYFIHADLPWTLGQLGKVMISPAAHRLHHIRDEHLMGYNFGNTVTLWDKLFGTYLDPAPYLNCETGIAEGTRNALGELVRPFDRRYWHTASRKSELEVPPAEPARGTP